MTRLWGALLAEAALTHPLSAVTRSGLFVVKRRSGGGVGGGCDVAGASVLCGCPDLRIEPLLLPLLLLLLLLSERQRLCDMT